MGSVAMDSDYGAPRELSALQKARALYQPELPPCLQVPPPAPYPRDAIAACRCRRGRSPPPRIRIAALRAPPLSSPAGSVGLAVIVEAGGSSSIGLVRRRLSVPNIFPRFQMGAGWGHPAPHHNSVGRCTSNSPTPVCSAPPSPSALHH
jgi:hypothetical protein